MAREKFIFDIRYQIRLPLNTSSSGSGMSIKRMSPFNAIIVVLQCRRPRRRRRQCIKVHFKIEQ